MNQTLTSILMPSSETPLSRAIKFWILLICQIPSVFSAIFILYQMVSQSQYRRLLANHVIIGLLLVSLFTSTVDLSITMDYLHHGSVRPRLPSFCTFWMFSDHYLYATGMLLMAWASVERHILLFAPSSYRSFRSTVLLHYIPLSFCFTAPLIFYLCNLLFYPCRHHSLNFDAILCGSSCFKLESPILDWFDMIVYSVIPSLVIIGGSLTLPVQFIRRKRRIQQNLFSWKRQRRLVVQLIAIASLYIIMNIPLFIVLFIRKCFLPTFAGLEYRNYLFYFYLLLIMLVPFICFGSLKGFWKFTVRRLRHITMFNQGRIAPQPLHYVSPRLIMKLTPVIQ